MAPAEEGARRGREWERARRGGAPAREGAVRAAAPAEASLVFSFRWRKTLRLRV